MAFNIRLDVTYMPSPAKKSGPGKEPGELLLSPGQRSGARYYDWGRNALYHLLKNRFPGKKVGLPAFICPSLAFAIRSAGNQTLFCDIDLNRMAPVAQKEFLEEIDLLFWPHILGYFSPIPQVGEKVVIEDRAHTLFSQSPECSGSRYQLFSLYKQMPYNNGALLAGPALNELGELPSGSFVGAGIKNLLPATLVYALRRRKALSADLPPVKEEFRPHEMRGEDFEGFEACYRYLQNHRESLMENYERYYELTDFDKLFYPVRKKKENDDPFLYTVILREEYASRRDSVVQALRKKGIFVDRLWYDFPLAYPQFSSLKGQFPYSEKAVSGVINLPLHHELLGAEVEKIMSELYRYLKP